MGGGFSVVRGAMSPSTAVAKRQERLGVEGQWRTERANSEGQMQGRLASESEFARPPPGPFIAGGARRQTRLGVRKYRIAFVSNGQKAVECVPPMVEYRGICVFMQSGDSSTSTKNKNKKQKHELFFISQKGLRDFFSNCRNPKRSQAWFEGWRLEGAASLARQSRPQTLQGTAVAPKGYC